MGERGKYREGESIGGQLEQGRRVHCQDRSSDTAAVASEDRSGVLAVLRWFSLKKRSEMMIFGPSSEAIHLSRKWRY